MTQKRVLLIGIDPVLATLNRPGGRSAAEITAAGNAAHERLAALGYAVQTCLIDLGATAERVVLEALRQHTFDCILIGAGIRALPQHTILFEQIINAVHQRAPAARLCFNSNPDDTVEAVLRWV